MSSHTNGPAGPTRFVESRRDAKKQEVPATEPKKQKGTTPPEEPQEVKQEEQRPIPTMGLPFQIYDVKRFFLGDKAIPPRLSKREAKLVAEKRAQEEARFIEEQARLAEEQERKATRAISWLYMRRLSDICPHVKVAFIGVKGGSATTTAAINVASTMARITGVELYAADLNPASGTMGARLGKNFNETVTISQFQNLIRRTSDHREISAALRPTKDYVRVLTADDYAMLTTEQFGTTAKAMLESLDMNCDYLLLDTPNDISTTAARAILEVADVVVFTAWTGMPDSLRLLYNSMQKTRMLGFPEKVTKSVVVISDINDSSSLDDYRLYLNRVDIEGNVMTRITPDDFGGPLAGIPHDEEIGLSRVVNLEKYKWETLQSYINLDIAILEQACILAGKELPEMPELDAATFAMPEGSVI